jgi:hypothetical protein
MIDQAIAQLQEALARDARSDEAYSLLGIAYGQKGMVNESIQALSTAVGLNPNSASAHMNLAAALQRAGRLHEAVAELNESLRIDPAYERARESLTAIQAQLQQQGEQIPAAPTTAPSPPSAFGSWEQATGAGTTCPSCKAENSATAQFCYQCGQALKGGAVQPMGVPAVQHVEKSSIVAKDGEIPFENRERYGGFFPALWETWREACFSPNTFFEKVGRSEDMGAPILFAVICGTLGTVVSFGFQMMFQSLLMGASGGQSGRQQMGLSMLFGAGMSVGMVVLMPLFIVLGLYLGAGILHLCLTILGGATKSYAVTLRTLGYVYAAQVFVAIPFCGNLIGGIWAIVLEIIGLTKVHETDTWRVVLAIFLPAIVCCGGIFTIAMMVGLAGSGGFK